MVRPKGKDDGLWIASKESCVQCQTRALPCKVRPDTIEKAKIWMAARAATFEHNADPDTKRKARTANTSCLECAAQNGNGGPCCFPSLVALCDARDTYFSKVKQVKKSTTKTKGTAMGPIEGSSAMMVEGSSKDGHGIVGETGLYAVLQGLLLELKAERELRAEREKRMYEERRQDRKVLVDILHQITATYPLENDTTNDLMYDSVASPEIASERTSQQVSEAEDLTGEVAELLAAEDLTGEVAGLVAKDSEEKEGEEEVEVFEDDMPPLEGIELTLERNTEESSEDVVSAYESD